MKNCIECNYKFTFSDRCKGYFFNLKGYLKCPQCSSIYKPIRNIYRFIYYFLVIFIGMNIASNIIVTNSIFKFISYVLIVTLVLSLFDILPHRFQKYKKIN